MMRLVTAYAKIDIFCLTVLSNDVLLTQLACNLLSQLPVSILIDGKLYDVQGHNVLARIVYDIFLDELLRNQVFIINEERIELS